MRSQRESRYGSQYHEEDSARVPRSMDRGLIPYDPQRGNRSAAGDFNACNSGEEGLRSERGSVHGWSERQESLDGRYLSRGRLLDEDAGYIRLPDRLGRSPNPTGYGSSTGDRSYPMHRASPRGNRVNSHAEEFEVDEPAFNDRSLSGPRSQRTSGVGDAETQSFRPRRPRLAFSESEFGSAVGIFSLADDGSGDTIFTPNPYRPKEVSEFRAREARKGALSYLAHTREG